MDPDVPEDDLRERDDYVVWLRDLHDLAVHFGDGAGDGRRVDVVGNANGGWDALAVCYRVDFFDHFVFAFACVDDDVGAVFFAQFEAFVPGVDADDFEAEGFGELDTEMSLHITEAVRSGRCIQPLLLQHTNPPPDPTSATHSPAFNSVCNTPLQIVLPAHASGADDKWVTLSGNGVDVLESTFAYSAK